MQYDLHATTDRQDILVLHRIFAEAGLRRELSRTKASAIREAPPFNPTSAFGGTILIVSCTPSSENPLFSTGGLRIRQNSD